MLLFLSHRLLTPLRFLKIVSLEFSVFFEFKNTPKLKRLKFSISVKTSKLSAFN